MPEKWVPGVVLVFENINTNKEAMLSSNEPRFRGGGSLLSTSFLSCLSKMLR